MSCLWDLVILTLLVGVCQSQSTIQPWSYTCDEYKRCIREDIQTNANNPLGLFECLLTCESGALFWPLPRELERSQAVIQTTHPDNIQILNIDYYRGTKQAELLQTIVDEQVEWLRKRKPTSFNENPSNTAVHINFYLQESGSTPPRITKNTDEEYYLQSSYDGNADEILVNITANNYFGARHAVETLFQSLEFDDVRNSFIALTGFSIRDYPEFSHRGLSLDSSRNFMTVEVIKRLIDGLAQSKLNVLHWHIVDTHSYPVEQLASPIDMMTQYGAYGPDMVYSQANIRDIVAYANDRGVRVIPELDQPAHVGNGWNFPGAENFVVCLNVEPWYDYCVEPPCGQLNPSEPLIYNILEQIYSEWKAMFDFDTFHMGADEVFFPCWNSSSQITDYMQSKGWARDDAGFIALWSEFQRESSTRLKTAVNDPNMDIIIWTSHITQEEYLDQISDTDYIVQIWTNGTDTNDPQIKALADNDIRMIFSNYDAMYLDCGFSAWVGEGNNWCSPYKGWQLQYSNDPYKLLEDRGIELTQAKKDLVLGGEVAMWSEQVDSQTVEGKVFPRATALAERLWSSPTTGWYDAETRFLHQRDRLVVRGVRSDVQQPGWCLRNSGSCYGLEGYYPANPTDLPPTTPANNDKVTTSAGVLTKTSLTLLAFSLISFGYNNYC